MKVNSLVIGGKEGEYRWEKVGPKLKIIVAGRCACGTPVLFHVWNFFRHRNFCVFEIFPNKEVELKS